MSNQVLLANGVRSDSDKQLPTTVHDSLQLSACWGGSPGTLTVLSDGSVAFNNLQTDKSTGLCGCPGRAGDLMVPGNNVLGAALLNGTDVRLHWSQAKALTASRQTRTLKHCTFKCASAEDATKTVGTIRSVAAWGGAEKPKQIQVIINPKSGPGNAPTVYKKKVQPLFEAAGLTVNVLETQHAGHAREYISALDISGVDTIACAGGDGTMFEVVQGLMERSDWETAIKMPLAQLPLGSSNALCANAGYNNLVAAVHAILKGNTSPLDIVSVLQPSTGKRFYSFLALMYGALTNMDIGTEHLRWMGGNRVLLGGIQQIISWKSQPAEVAVVDAGVEVTAASGAAPGELLSSRTPAGPATPLLDAMGCVDLSQDLSSQQLPQGWQSLGTSGYKIFMVCNMQWLDNNMFRPASKAALNNGCIDLIYDQGCGRGDAIKMLLDSEKVASMASMAYRPVRAIVIRPLGQGTWLTADGEVLPFEPIAAEVHAGLARLVVAS